jgi:non-specific serine/threonine protein kinase
LIDTLADALREKSLLLVLDNCEHLQSACVHLADVLLRRCLNLRILATSREPLGLSDETLWRVPSLSLPDPQRLPPLDQMPRYEAVRLFVERVRSGQPGFALTTDAAPAIAQICHQLDGIPMAIELAAARARALAVEQIASRLDDRFRLLTQGSPTALPRNRTLLATMDWSYDLLTETERVMLRRLSVFAGGWTLEAAETVCSGDGVEVTDVLDLLTTLVDKSLVVADTHGGEARYRFHETVRQYSRDRLHDAGETANVRRRHRDWHLRFAERAEANLRGPEQGSWFERLETEHGNLRAGLEYSKTEEDDATGEVRFAAALQWFWFLHGHWTEGLAWLEGALARSDKAPPTNLPKVLLGAGRITWFQGAADRAAPIFERGLALCRDLGDTEVIPGFFYWVGRRASRQADFARATALLEEGLGLCRERGDTWWASQLLAERGDLEQYRSDYEAAATFYLEGLALSRGTGGINNTMLFLHNLGCVALYQGDIGQATAYYTECLVLCRQVRHRLITAGCLEGLAVVASDHENHERAARLFAAASAFQETLGSGSARYPAAQAPYDRGVASTQAGLGDSAFAAASATGRAMTLEQAVEYALQSEGAAPPRPATQGRIAKRGPADLLTAREREVAALVAQGLTNRQIAGTLVVTERTAETHLQNI